MQKKIFLFTTVFSLVLSQVCFADEKSDAEAAITQAENMLAELNSMGGWVGPALLAKMEAENYLKMAKDAFDAGKYAEAKQYAEKSLKSAEKAAGLRAWSLLTGARLVQGGSGGIDT